MIILVLGLVIFLGIHSVRIVADDWRTAQIARLGLRKWKLIYTVIALIGLALVIWGYAMARHSPVLVWAAPTGMRHLALLLTLVAFILVAAADGPPNSIKSRLHHPMVIGVSIWAIAHLLANGMLADIVLFGSFLVWALLSWQAARRRDRIAKTTYRTGTTKGNVITVGAGVVVWALFAFWLHQWLIGVSPLG